MILLNISSQREPPIPVPTLWGLWVVTGETPDGFWINHTNGPNPE